MSARGRVRALAATLLLALAAGATLPGAPARADDAATAGGGAADGEADRAGEPGEGEPGLLGRVGRSIDDTQRRASEGFIDFVSSVDGFFADDTASEIDNESRARLRLGVERPGGEDLGFDATVKLRVVLPHAERRFRLLLSSEEEDEDSVVGDEGTIRPARLDRTEGQDVSLALRFIRTARETSSVKLDVGLRQREGLVQVYGRLTTVAEGELAHRWEGRASNSYYYYARSGYENRLHLDATRRLSRLGNLYFRAASSFNWRRGTKGARLGQSLGLYADLGERTAVALEALAGYSTSVIDGRPRYGGAEIRIRFRRNALRPWFFYEVWPSVAWPAQTDYERAWGGLLRFEILFGRVEA